MTQFSDSLKKWRKARRFSQLDLATEAEVSTRHLSFLETGRAKPSPEMIGRLGDALNLSLAVRNQLLAQAGFAARYTRRDWDATDMAPVRDAVSYTLQRHAPYPALSIDRHWTIIDLNAPAAHLFALVGADKGVSLVDILLDPNVQKMIENWPEVAHHAAHRLRTEIAAHGGDARLEAAAEALAAVPQQFAPEPKPVVPTIYRAGDLRLSLFSTLAQFGTPEDLMLDDLRIELFFPADAETATTLHAMASALQHTA